MGVAVKLVLDTHIWLWWIMQELDRFPAHWSTLIEEADQVLISPVSCFEVALACKRGRIQLQFTKTLLTGSLSPPPFIPMPRY